MSVYTVILPNGDQKECRSWEAAQLAAETLIDDACKFLRQNLVVKKDGELDASATAMLQSDGMLV